MKLEVDELYTVCHIIKGKFTIRVTSQDNDWVTGIVMSGKADAVVLRNIRRPGDEITFKKSLANFRKAPSGMGRRRS